jgi:phosphoglycerol geranylgeranyltransferase
MMKTTFPKSMSAGIGAHRPLLRFLQQYRGTSVHGIDPYKVPVAEAVEKVKALSELGFPVVLINGTDYVAFEEHVGPYLAALRKAGEIKIVLQFPPTKGKGAPFCAGADGIILNVSLHSSDPYFMGEAIGETEAELESTSITPRPELCLSASLTFGPDEKSFRAGGALPVSESFSMLRGFANRMREGEFEMVELFSRNARVAPEICRFFRGNLRPDQLLFVSGNVRSWTDAHRYLEAGADYVVFGTVLETPHWRRALAEVACPPEHLAESRQSMHPTIRREIHANRREGTAPYRSGRRRGACRTAG